MGFSLQCGLQLVCGDNSGMNGVEQTLGAGWTDDPVHLTGHIYAKTALSQIEKVAPTAVSANAASRKRTWSASNSSCGGSSSCRHWQEANRRSDGVSKRGGGGIGHPYFNPGYSKRGV
jgi:hypothetical protein